MPVDAGEGQGPGGAEVPAVVIQGGDAQGKKTKTWREALAYMLDAVAGVLEDIGSFIKGRAAEAEAEADVAILAKEREERFHKAHPELLTDQRKSEVELVIEKNRAEVRRLQSQGNTRPDQSRGQFPKHTKPQRPQQSKPTGSSKPSAEVFSQVKPREVSLDQKKTGSNGFSNPIRDSHQVLHDAPAAPQ